MSDVLFDCMANFGNAPRKFSTWDRVTYLRVSRPAWLREFPTDKLALLFSHMSTLFREGRVVWGHIIQANALLFEEGNEDCPGEFVYSLADPNIVKPEHLQKVASSLSSLKGTKPRHPKLAPIANYLTDERIRVFGLQVPKAVSPKVMCRISTTFFVRKHLPNRRLCKPLMPLVVHTQEPYVVMPLPEKYWPEDLIAWWNQ
ncbi:MAG: hypothetical protein AAGD11_04895 [Planctomycetota bacterium]